MFDFQIRRREDSNLRGDCSPTGFRDRRVQPLCHASISRDYLRYVVKIAYYAEKNNPSTSLRASQVLLLAGHNEIRWNIARLKTDVDGREILF